MEHLQLSGANAPKPCQASCRGGARSPFQGKTIADTKARTRTGVSIVAVLRGEQAVPAPEPSFRLEAGDVVVVVGTTRGIEQLAVLLRSG
jgi:K+:H+ antiporter subunit KhtT